MVAAIERMIHAHEVYINNVHEQKKLGLCARRLCDELMHSTQCRHCGSVLVKLEPELVAELSPLSSVSMRPQN